jgi:TolA-binding protein
MAYSKTADKRAHLALSCKFISCFEFRREAISWKLHQNSKLLRRNQAGKLSVDRLRHLHAQPQKEETTCILVNLPVNFTIKLQKFHLMSRCFLIIKTTRKRMKSQTIFVYIFIFASILLAAATTSAQYDSDKLFAFLQDSYKQNDKKVYDFLIAELNQYLDIFPEVKNTAEAQYLLAKIYEAKGDKHEALASFLKTMYLYPNSARHEECANGARLIISKEKAYAPKKEKLLAIVDGPFEGDTLADRHYDYLGFLVELDDANLYNWTVDEAKRFISRFPNDERVEIVLREIADLYAKKGEHREAAFSYLKIEYAYSESPLLPYTRYSRGVMLYKELGETQKAIEVFTQVVTQYPQSEYAGTSIFMLAEIKQKKTKDHKGAIAEYRKFIDTYPDNAKVIDALFAIAEINADKLAAYAEAIAAYDEIVAKDSTDERGAKALEKAGDLYKNKFGDYAKAAEYYAKVAEVYPSYEKAPDLLLEAGSLSEMKLKDDKKAMEYYETILAKFPASKRAGEAKRRMAKLQEKPKE